MMIWMSSGYRTCKLMPFCMRGRVRGVFRRGGRWSSSWSTLQQNNDMPYNSAILPICSETLSSTELPRSIFMGPPFPQSASSARQGVYLSIRTCFSLGGSQIKYNYYPMVIVNYQNFLRECIQQQLQQCKDKLLRGTLSSKELEQLVICLYQYCQELNIIKRRIQKLKFYTSKNEIIMPKLIDSEITRIDSKAKEISTAYSLFLFKQKKFKVFSNQSKYYEHIIAAVLRIVVEKCFSKEDIEHLSKEVNRLFRTNTFNTTNCWSSYLEIAPKDSHSYIQCDPTQTNFRAFRRTVYSESSQIRPYVNNKSCFKSLKARSPLISLWHPNSEFMSFSLARKKGGRNKFQL